MYQAQNKRTNHKIVYLAFGSNMEKQLQGSQQIIQSAYAILAGECLTNIKYSHFYRTPAFPKGNGLDYVNSVIKAETELSPQDLLDKLHSVENQLGRTRDKRWGSRVIDIDLLDYDSCVVPSLGVFHKWQDMSLASQKTEWPKELILPHPRMQDRGFVLVPLRAVDPNWVHPVSGKSVGTLLARIEKAELQNIMQI